MKVRFVHRWDSDCFSAPEGATGVVDEVSYNTRYEQHRINVKLDDPSVAPGCAEFDGVVSFYPECGGSGRRLTFSLDPLYSTKQRPLSIKSPTLISFR